MELGLPAAFLGERALALQQQRATGAHRLLARREFRSELKARRNLLPQALIEIVARCDDFLDRACVLLGERAQLIVLRQLGCEAARQFPRARLLTAQSSFGDGNSLGVIVPQLLELSFVPLRVITQLLLGPLRHLLSEGAMLGETCMLRRQRVDARGMLIALQL